MATKSILKTIHIKEKNSARALVNALENAKGKTAKSIVVSRAYSEASRSDIKKIFGVSE